MNNLYETLLSLSEIDAQIEAKKIIKSDLVLRLKQGRKKLALEQDRLEQKTKIHTAKKMEERSTESQIAQEQERLVARRKQISEIGGAKGAKLSERELDIATRTVKLLEETLLKLMQDSEAIEKESEAIKLVVAELDAAFIVEEESVNLELSEIESALTTLLAERAPYFNQIDDRSIKIYDRVRSRYPAQAVVRVQQVSSSGGSCGGCHRSLPFQLLNEISHSGTGKIFNCPGCSRILVPPVMTADDELALQEQANG
jgi:predicted  nucleic acid-binding Zn-ribbon protein